MVAGFSLDTSDEAAEQFGLRDADPGKPPGSDSAGYKNFWMPSVRKTAPTSMRRG
jgi:hypothetical protein